MKVEITPSKCSGSVHLPPSKSMSHRAIICASLAKGRSIISNVAFSDDILVTIAGMQQLGAHIETKDDQVIIDGGIDFASFADNQDVFCKESGSTLRFFIPIFSLTNKNVSFTGENRLLKRPQKVYEDLFHEKQLHYTQDASHIRIQGSLQPGAYSLAGDVSSQFISGLLFALPLLKQDSTIHIQAPYESRSYVDLTLQMLAHYGIDVVYQDPYTLYIKGNQTYQAADYTIEGDYSQAGFFAVLAAINNDLTITGLSHDSKQGDKQIIDILKDFHVDVTPIPFGYEIKKSQLSSATINLENCPDLGPILNVLQMYTQKESTIINAGRLRLKESDRILAMESELQACGVNYSSTLDTITIHGNPPYTPTRQLSGHKDHRIVMALAIAATCMKDKVIIDEAGYINKSYPTFFEDLASVGIEVRYVK